MVARKAGLTFVGRLAGNGVDLVLSDEAVSRVLAA
jgi:hypothetical protein